MERNKRVYLEEGQSVYLSIKSDGSNPEKYLIRSVVGEGWSAVCYEAIRERDGQVGRLKEFYPMDVVVGDQRAYYSLERREDGQLIPIGGNVRKFGHMCAEFIENYYLLNKIIAENPQNQILKNYIQNGEVLYGSIFGAGKKSGIFSEMKKLLSDAKSDECTSVYIWSSGIVGEGFDKYIEEVRRHPEERAERKLYDILQTVATLTDGIKALHTAGLMHLDIKPSNFLVAYDSNYDINASSISMFDINTLYSIDSEYPKIAGTEGYRAPEVLRGRADNRSDIYSIGAMLFNALIVHEGIPDGLYRASYYSEIRRLVKESKLIVSAQSGADKTLVSGLAKVLKKCLSPQPDERYESCNKLLSDLKKLAGRAEMYAVGENVVGQNRRVAIVDDSVRGMTDPAIVIQKLLYNHPLYESLVPGAENINLLVIGAGEYAWKFIDISLQVGQMKGCLINITVVTSGPDEEREHYLSTRPALDRFVNVDGSMGEGTARSYGSIRFLSVDEATGRDGYAGTKFMRGSSQEAAKNNYDIVSDIIRNNEPNNYVFVSLSSDRMNYSVAKAFSDIMLDDDSCIKCPVGYVSEKAKKTTAAARKAMLYPVCVNEEITADTIDVQLERMAFNTHIAWESTLNIDVKKKFNEFCENDYYYSSSMAYVLSVRYKLYSIGIVLESDLGSVNTSDAEIVVVKNLAEAASVFSEKVLARKESDPKAKKKFDTLVALEHRRWVIDRVTAGWDVPRDENGQPYLECCVKNGRVKNKGAKTHPCIVFSTEETPLSGNDYQKDGHKKWETVPIDPNLDELDHMSVALHQCMKKRAGEFRSSNPLKTAQTIGQIISNCNENVTRTYKHFLFCLKNILNGVESYTRQYDHYCGKFKEALEKAAPELCDEVKAVLDTVKKEFFPVIEANLHRNYKAIDERLIEKIPFILTYSFRLGMAMAFEDGRRCNGCNEAVFANVAAATLLSPERIDYLYRFDRTSDRELLINKISAVLNYLGKRDVHCTVSFNIAWIDGVEGKESLRAALDGLMYSSAKDGNAVLGCYNIFECMSNDEVAAGFMEYLVNSDIDLYSGDTDLFDSALENGQFVSRVAECGVPYFEFDWRRKRFAKSINCDYLKFIDNESCIMIKDMFALMNAVDTGFNLPEFADDYETLWNIYCGNYGEKRYGFSNGVGNWNRLCSLLEKYEDEQKPLAIIKIDRAVPQQIEEMVYPLPIELFDVVRPICDKLIEYGIVGKQSALVSVTSYDCRLTLYADPSLKGAFDALFINNQNALGCKKVELCRKSEDNGDSLVIRCNELAVKNVDLDPENKGKAVYSYTILQQLEKKHYISRLERNANDTNLVSFLYASPRIKELLTSAGAMLEVYAYYQVLKTGYFDDVACGYEFRWEKGGVKNELDLVLTKGFRSIIIECKAVQKLELNYYHKLHSIAEHFGIGSIKVLIGNTYRTNSSNILAVNDMQRTRGEQLGIKTFSEMDELTNIGEVLVELMESMA